MPKTDCSDSSTGFLETQISQRVNHPLNTDQLMNLVGNLKKEISVLKLELSRSESLRKGMELKLAI